MKRLLPALVLAVTGCALLSSQIQTDQVEDTVGFVVERHDAYVISDESLADATEAQYLAESAALLALITAQDEVLEEVFVPVLTPVADRHDAYVTGDGSLSDLERRTYLRSTSELRGLTTAD